MRSLGLTIFAAVTALLAAVAVGSAKPPPGADPSSAVGTWYRSLKQPGTGFGCCSEADCHPVKARVRDDGRYEVGLNDVWYIVPDQLVITDKTHPAGDAVLCVVGGKIFCFVPGVAGG